MTIPQTTQGVTLSRSRVPVSWVTIALFAIVIAYVDGFWVTSLQGAVGAVENSQAPFSRWLRDSTLMLPLFCLAAFAALALTHRWFGQRRREMVKLAAAALLIIVISTAVSIAEVATTAVSDYKIQVSGTGLSHSSHVTAVATGAARHATLMAHVRGVGYASVVLLVTNLVLVLWVLALRGGRLWRRFERTPMSAASVVPEEWSVA